MANEQNLKPFKPGQSGNPNGRPKGVPNTKTRLERILTLIEKQKNPVTGEIENFTVAELLDLKQVSKARGGDTRAYNSILDRLEGKPKFFTDITSGEKPIQILGGISELPSDDSNQENSETKEEN